MSKIFFKLQSTYFAIHAYPITPLLFHQLSHGLGDVHALAVVPLFASVAAYHETVVVRLVANAPELVGIVLGLVLIAVRTVEFVSRHVFLIQRLRYRSTKTNLFLSVCMSCKKGLRKLLILVLIDTLWNVINIPWKYKNLWKSWTKYASKQNLDIFHADVI